MSFLQHQHQAEQLATLRATAEAMARHGCSPMAYPVPWVTRGLVARELGITESTLDERLIRIRTERPPGEPLRVDG